MEKRVAVVFDSAGTLLHMYRVAKEMSTGSILEDVQTTLLVSQKKYQALIILSARFDKLDNCDLDMELHEFIGTYGINLGISCSSSPFYLDDVYDIIRQNNIKVSDVNDVVSQVRGRCPNVFYVAAGLIVDSEDNIVPYVLSTGGQVYSSTIETVRMLRELGTDIYIASGDDGDNLSTLASFLDIPASSVFPVATTHDKGRIVRDLKKNYEKVLMVGDGMNDILALRAADVGILSTQQGDERPQVLMDAADIKINNIIDVVDIVKKFGDQATS